jgi:colanic acid/amylovoran biosynthesis protein
MMVMKKILIINGYSENIGDLGILHGTIRGILDHMKGSYIHILITDPSSARRHVKVNQAVTFGDPLTSREDSLIVQCYNLFKVLAHIPRLMAGRKRFPVPAHPSLDAYGDADLIISCGGGYLNDSYGIASLGCLLEILLGVISGKKVFLLGQSIGPYSSRTMKFITGKVLDMVSLITLRDYVSVDYLESMKVARPMVKITADFAFLLPAADRELGISLIRSMGLEGERYLVTMTVKPWYFPGGKDPRAAISDYICAMAGLINHAIRRHGATVILIPMDVEVAGEGEGKRRKSLSGIKGLARQLVRWEKRVRSRVSNLGSERVFIDEICKRVEEGNKGRLVVVRRILSPVEVKSLVSLSWIHVATRMHSAIFALSEGVPVLGIAYEPKLTSLMERLGLGEHVLDINQAGESDLVEMFESLWNGRDDISRRIKPGVDLLKEKALENIAMISEALGTDERRWPPLPL